MPLDQPRQVNATSPASPALPADHGLTSLGLLMQIGGSLFLGLMIFVGIAAVFAGFLVPKGINLIMIAAFSAVRSAAHVSAGRALVHGSTRAAMSGPLAPTRRYILVALGQTVVCVLLLHDFFDDTQVAMSMGATWLAWPVALWFVMRSPRVASMESGIPRSEDHGFEGASVFMFLFGVIGTLFAGLVIYQMTVLLDRSFFSFEVLSVFAIFGVLLIRSVLQMMAGRRGLAGDLGEVREQTRRYTNFAAMATVIVGVLLFVSAGREGGSFIFVFLIIHLLLAWPRIIARFMDQSDVDRYISGVDKAMQRPPDMGLTALGWVLLALAVHGLAGDVSSFFWPEPGLDGAMFGFIDNTPLAEAFGQSVWLSLVISASQLWAAIALIRMNADYKLAATVYGLVATAVTLITVWPLFQGDSFMGSLMTGPDGVGGIALLGQVGIGLTVPLAALALVRRQPLARAQARYRVDDEAA